MGYKQTKQPLKKTVELNIFLKYIMKRLMNKLSRLMISNGNGDRTHSPLSAPDGFKFAMFLQFSSKLHLSLECLYNTSIMNFIKSS